MPGQDLDLEKADALGGIDRLVTNFAISTIAVIPTFSTCLIRPSRLRSLLDRDFPDGRAGMLLAPGLFFPLSLLVSFITAALLSTPETVSTSGSYIGPGLAVSVQAAASEGDIWKIVATVMPIYGFAVIMGLLGSFLRGWSLQNWSLRVSLRAAFYVTGTLTSWLILTTVIIDLIGLRTGRFDIVSLLYSAIAISTIAAVFWIYFVFFRNDGEVSRMRAIALSFAMVGLIVGVIQAIETLLLV